jgi:hypothetical protein
VTPQQVEPAKERQHESVLDWRCADAHAGRVCVGCLGIARKVGIGKTGWWGTVAAPCSDMGRLARSGQPTTVRAAR